MKINYMINGVCTTKSLTEWYCGKDILKRLTDAAVRSYKRSGKNKTKIWLEGTGYLTILID